MEDFKSCQPGASKPGRHGLFELLRQGGVRYTSYGDWKKIDREEIERGRINNKPRAKVVTIDEMIAIVDK